LHLVEPVGVVQARELTGTFHAKQVLAGRSAMPGSSGATRAHTAAPERRGRVGAPKSKRAGARLRLVGGQAACCRRASKATIAGETSV
jgi:hypothetical protein